MTHRTERVGCPPRTSGGCFGVSHASKVPLNDACGRITTEQGLLQSAVGRLQRGGTSTNVAITINAKAT